MERLHRPIDSEFYVPRLKEIKTCKEFVELAHRWIGFYNIVRPHMGKEMDGKSLFEKAKELIPTLNNRIALMPPIILDELTNDKLFTMHLVGKKSP